MIFFILLGQFATLFLSQNFTTSITFETPIEKVIYGGGKNDIFSYLSKDKKTLTLKAIQDNINTNLTIIGSEGRNSNFWVKVDQNNPHVYVQIKDGILDISYKKVFENDQIEILEGEKSSMIVNKTAHDLLVNKQKIAPNSKEYFSKGIPFLMDGRRIFQ